MGNATFEGFYLGINAYLSGGQTRNTHLHLDELYPTRFLGLSSYLLHLADGSLGKILNAKLRYQRVNYFSFNRSFHKNYFLARINTALFQRDTAVFIAVNPCLLIY